MEAVSGQTVVAWAVLDPTAAPAAVQKAVVLAVAAQTVVASVQKVAVVGSSDAEA